MPVDSEVSALTALTGANVAVGDWFPIVDVSVDETKKISAAEARVAMVGDSLREKYLKPPASYENFTRANGMQPQAVLTSGTVALTAIALPKDLLVTSISFCSGNTAAISPTNWWFTLCDESYLALRSTADQTSSAWGANTVKTVNLTSTFTTTYEGLHYLAIMVAAATVPNIQGALNTVTTNGILPMIGVVGLAGQTTPPSNGTNLATSPVGKSTNPWAYVS